VTGGFVDVALRRPAFAEADQGRLGDPGDAVAVGDLDISGDSVAAKPQPVRRSRQQGGERTGQGFDPAKCGRDIRG